MKIFFKSLMLVLNLLAFSVVIASAIEALSPDQVAQMTYNRYVGNDMQMRGTMELIDKNGHIRSRNFTTIRKDAEGKRQQLIRFTAPADIDGTAFLNIEADDGSNIEQHLYLPALKRTRRIVASQKARSFVNSDFTYEDMQRHPVEEWDYQLDGAETISGRDCYVLISLPKPGNETQYNKVASWVDKENFIPLKIIFFDNDGRQVKSYIVNSFKIIDNIATETEVVMEDLLSGHKTRLQSFDVRYNSGLKDSLFTTRALER